MSSEPKEIARFKRGLWTYIHMHGGVMRYWFEGDACPVCGETGAAKPSDAVAIVTSIDKEAGTIAYSSSPDDRGTDVDHGCGKDVRPFNK